MKRYFKYPVRAILTLLLLTLTGVGAWALTAVQVMDKVCDALRKAPSLEVKMNIDNGTSGSYNAILTVSREKFRYSFGTMTVYYDGTSQWTVDNDAKEVSLTTPTADEIAETNPLAFVNNFRTNYTVSNIKESGGTYSVRLTAKSKSSYVRSADVVVSGSTWLPTHITAKLSSGQTLTIRVLSAVKGAALAASQFKYDTKKNPDYELIDLR